MLVPGVFDDMRQREGLQGEYFLGNVQCLVPIGPNQWQTEIAAKPETREIALPRNRDTRVLVPVGQRALQPVSAFGFLPVKRLSWVSHSLFQALTMQGMWVAVCRTWSSGHSSAEESGE